LDPGTRHKHLAPLGGENATNHAGDKVFIWSNFDTTSLDDPNVIRRISTIDPKDLIGRTFLKDTKADGQRFRAKIVRAIVDKDSELQKDPRYTKLLCEANGDVADDIFT
jgi:hypothetical protein